MTGIDVIVIGSGLGGLTAAALFARAGYKVIVFEKHYVAGGYATVFSRRHFTFDVSLHGMGGLDPEGLVRRNLELCGVWDRLKFVQPAYCYRSILPYHDLRVPQRNLKKYIDTLSDIFPGERVGLMQLVDRILETYEQCRQLLINCFKDLFTNARAYDLVLKYSRCTQQDLINEFIKDEVCKTIFCHQWNYYGVPPSKLPAISFIAPWVEFMVGGLSYPVGKSQAIVRALIEVIEANGGHVMLRTPVEKIIIKNKKAQGVLVAKGQFVPAQIVISNVNPLTMVHQLAGPEFFPDAYVSRLNSLKKSLSSFLIFLGLDVSVREHFGFEDYEVIETPSYDLEEIYKKCKAGDLENTEMVVIVPENLYQSGSHNEGTAQVIISTLSGYERWSSLSHNHYKELKRRFASHFVDRLNRLMPGVKDHVLVQTISSPLTNIRYTQNPQGAIYGWDRDIEQFNLVRNLSRTPIENLYLSSAWAFPGGGYSGAIWAGYFCVHENNLIRQSVSSCEFRGV